MKISTRLAIRFSILASSILGLSFVLMYHSFDRYFKDQFYRKLENRTEIAFYNFFKDDEIPAELFREFEDKFAKSLADEKVQIYDSSNHLYFPQLEGVVFSPKMLEAIRDNGDMRFTLENGEYAYGSFIHDNLGDFVIIVFAPDHAGRERIGHLSRVMWYAFLASVLLLIIFGRLFALRALAPVDKINRKVRGIDENNLKERLSGEDNKDELSRLTQTFNQMLCRIENAFETQKSFVHHVSHELRTPLTSMIGKVQVTLSKERSQEEYRDVLEDLHMESMRVKDLVNALLLMAQTENYGSDIMNQDLRLDELVLDVLEDCAQKYPEALIDFKMDNPPESQFSGTIRGNAELVKTALINIVDNALKFSDNSPVLVSLHYHDGMVDFSCTDQGDGMDPETLKHIFDKFFRSKDAHKRKGFGIGMTLTKRILDLCHAVISIESEKSVGTKVTVNFPAVEE